jgi:folate-binding protein YgfZ
MEDSTGFRRTAAGVLDLTGEDREAFLQGQCTNDVLALPKGGVTPAAALTPKGKLLAVFRAAKLVDRLRILLPAEIASDLEAHLGRFAVFQRVQVQNRSADYARFNFYGRLSPELPQAQAGGVVKAEFQDVPIEVWPHKGPLCAVWLAQAGTADRLERTLDEHCPRVTAEQAEVRRVEAGEAAFGIDIDSSNHPAEAGLEEAISSTKGCYVGQEVVARLKTYGRVNKRLVGFSFGGGYLPSRGSILFRQEEPEKEAGRVTSAVLSPRFGAIGLGFARREVEEGDSLRFLDDPSRSAIVTRKSRI